MIIPELLENEQERLKDLDSYSILDTFPEEDYDNLTAIAAQICGTPISLVSLVDDKRQWFKSHHGLSASETPREYAFCAHAIHDKENFFIVQDARIDERFHDNPLVTGEPHVIFYAGIPLVSDEGFPLGTLCVIDHEPKLLSEGQLSSLRALSKQVMNLLNLRKKKVELEEALVSLKEKNRELDQFAFVAAHDLKSPLIGISSMAQLMLDQYESQIDEEGQNLLSLMVQATDRMRNLIDGLLNYSRSECCLKEEKSIVNVAAMKKDLINLFSYDNDMVLVVKSKLKEITVNRTALDQILINLIANAIKYSDKEVVKIEIGISENDTHYLIYIEDNGPGIEDKYFNRIFKIFEVVAAKDKFGNAGNGIGLATVKKIVTKSGGDIVVTSELGRGTRFAFSLEK